MGRPPKWKSEDALDKACEAYFQECIQKKEIPSKAGLRVHLDLIKERYSDYKKKYPHPIKKAENLIEKAWVNRLSGVAATGAIFYLKNAFFEDYRDRHETDITSGGKPLNISFDTVFKNESNRTTADNSKK